MSVQHAALAAVNPVQAIQSHVTSTGSKLVVDGRSYDLAGYERVWLVGGGKAATAMTAALYTILGDRLAGGLVVTKYHHVDPDLNTGPVQVIEAGHPLPDEAGVEAGRRMADLLKGVSDRDLVVAVLSGGGSALLTLPAGDLTLEDLQATTNLLLRSGVTIVEMNTVRKHLSAVKGGGLARLIGNATVLCLVLSDVIGDPLDAIASGPLVPDPTTFGDAWSIVKARGLVDAVPSAVRQRLEAGRRGEVADTPKPGSSLFDRVQTVIVGSNRVAAEAAAQAARSVGFNALLLSTFVEGEARQVARVASALAQELVRYDRPVRRPACLVWGGETTVTVRGSGKGGRNQELALAAAIALEDLEGVVLLALGTDGTDGPTDAAGAIATGRTVERARERGLDASAYLDDNDAYPFFEALGDLIRTGPTGTNVNDLMMLFALP